MYENIIKKTLNEAFSQEEKEDIKTEVVKILKTSDLKSVIEDIVSKELKGNKELEKEVLSISKNVLTQLFKTLWNRRGYWQSALVNKAS
jgi:uncharacterized membrane protein YheB (UPF0754 family)